jgi:hypothetical protein
MGKLVLMFRRDCQVEGRNSTVSCAVRKGLCDEYEAENRSMHAISQGRRHVVGELAPQSPRQASEAAKLDIGTQITYYTYFISLQRFQVHRPRTSKAS